jgi:gliding motility-associated-like protein
VGNFQIPIGPAPTIVSVTASDPLGCLVIATASVNPAPPIPSFTIANITGSYSITCTYPYINLDAQTTYSYNNGTLNFFWASNTSTFSTSNVVITNPGVYTVNAVDPVTNCGTTQTVSVGINTIQPLSTISPSNQVINCSVSSITNVTATVNQTVNVSQTIISPQGSSYSVTSSFMVFPPGTVGTFTHCALNEVNGCQTCKQFTVQSNQGFPTFGLTSPENYTLGCTTRSVATINIINGSATGTNQVPNGGPVSYTILGPPTSTFVPPTGNLSGNSSYTVNVPGTWTIVVRDNTNFCESRVYQSILQNTVTPDISVAVPQRILDCNTPKVTAVAQSTTPGVGFLWSFPGTPGNQPGDTITIFSNTTALTSSVIANYTLTNTDLSSTCKSTTVIPMFQSLYVPKAGVTNGGVSAISCKVNSLVLTNQSSSTIPPSTGFSNGFPVVGFLWKGPTPQIEESNVSTYNAYTPGSYTMIVKDMNNGCTSFTTISIADERDYPVISAGTPTRVLDCAAKFAVLNPTVSPPQAPSTFGDLTYAWTTEVSEANLDGQDKLELHPGKPGEYILRVLNTRNGCPSEISMTVVNGTLTPSFEVDQTSGIAPLTVNFKNNSTSSLGKTGISSVWSFGNGKLSNMPNSTKDTTMLYTQPGSYTVTLFVNKGQCLESTRKVINVEVPSKLIVPNIFTPNGDHINDLFHLQTTNLSSITAVIFDRWGNVVYELTSSTGNIAWDGKNQKGMDVAEGVYFYTIKATGKDGEEYNKTGNVTLTR